MYAVLNSNSANVLVTPTLHQALHGVLSRVISQQARNLLRTVVLEAPC